MDVHPNCFCMGSTFLDRGSYLDGFLFLQPDTTTGDIVFVLQLKEHPKFKRKGDDLFVEHTLSLTEALCGFHFPLTHLDGRQLLIKSNIGEIVKPGTFYNFLFFLWFWISRLMCVSNLGEIEITVIL